MSRSITAGQKRQLKAYCSQVVDGLTDLDFEAVKQFIDEGVGVRMVKDGLNSLFRMHIQPSTIPTSRVWTPNRVIQLGGVQDEVGMRAVLKSAGRQVGDWASNILPQVKYEGQGSVGLVWPSGDELGLTDEYPTVEQFHTAGLAQGLELCQAQDGPLLASQYPDQPSGEILRMAMKPLKDSDGDWRLFSVAHAYYGRWLHGGCGRPTDEYPRGGWFVFRCK